MSNKQQARSRRARRSRFKMRELGVNRLCIHRTLQHMYAQIIAPEGDKVLASASTLDPTLRASKTATIEAAEKVGCLIAERVQALGIRNIAFDRSGFMYHGRVKALAEAARAGGLVF